MTWNPFKIIPKGFLGVDIGTFSIKIVEVERAGKRRKLENYGEMQAVSAYEKPFRTFEKSTLSLSNKDIVRAISAIIKESKMKSVKAYFSIPDFSTFFTTITLPSMTEAEIPKAVQYEARQYIPLPLEGVTLDWQVIEKEQSSSSIKVLLVAVPNEVIQQYQETAAACGLELVFLEAEVFSLARAVIGEEESRQAVSLIDIGARSTTINIVDKGVLKISHSFDTSGNDLTSMIAKGLDAGYNKAEELKKKYGLNDSEEKTKEAMLPLIDLILSEIKKIFSSFYQIERKEVKKIILAGGSAFMPGLAEYFSKNLSKPIEIANPFNSLYYPPILEDALKQMGPSFSIAVGAALHGLE
ncbi:MAG: type IV pilus assembly protein PilM [Candidatus Nealsonbacteria bacterium]|nr:type IV pilus assembly protein PilM [Candidatus Nealsonbacteria bacterium]